MQLREATAGDIPEIVMLLKISLGEDLLPKTENFWYWKHVNNPFGPSPVLVAVADEKIVGVRAFMRWRWRDRSNLIEAVRAVDTATHPEFQGKGIFSKLTNAALKHCKEKNIRLVFNTPNNKSLPGYLKMGWETAGRLPVFLKPVRPFSIFKNLVTKNTQPSPDESGNTVSEIVNDAGFESLLHSHIDRENKFIVSDHTIETLRWRYLDVPVSRYFAIAVKGRDCMEGALFYRLKPSKFGLELRVTDMFVKTEDAIKDLKKLFYGVARQHQADYVTFAGLSSRASLLNGFFLPRLKVSGPIVTVRGIQDTDLDAYKSFKKWSPSLGDLELF